MLGSLIAAGVLLAAIGGGAWALISHYEGEGYDKRSAEVAPITSLCDELKHRDAKACASAFTQALTDNEQLAGNNALLEDRITHQNTELDKLAKAGAAARARAAKAEQDSAANAAGYANRITELQSRIDQPSEDPNAEADRILRALAVDRRVRAGK